MANFHDSAVVALDFWAFSKLSHTLGGLYIWEFFTTLDYEWHVMKGRVRYRWSIWIYSFTRLATLMVVVMTLAILNMTNPANCQVLILLSHTFGFTIFILSSLLIVLRIIAIWNWNKGIMGLAAILWLTNTSLIIHGIIRIHSAWIPGLLTAVKEVCSLLDLTTIKETFVSILITDFVLLVSMLIGLLRLRYHGAGTGGLGLLLWKQGLIWLLIATLAEVPPVVLICLGLNTPLDGMFMMASLIAISIAATRMYRSLLNFGNSTEIVMYSGP